MEGFEQAGKEENDSAEEALQRSKCFHEDDILMRLRKERLQLGVWAEQLRYPPCHPEKRGARLRQNEAPTTDFLGSAKAPIDIPSRPPVMKKPPYLQDVAACNVLERQSTASRTPLSRSVTPPGKDAVKPFHEKPSQYGRGGPTSVSTSVLAFEMENERLRKTVEVLTLKLQERLKEQPTGGPVDESVKQHRQTLHILQQERDAFEQELSSVKKENLQREAELEEMGKINNEYAGALKNQEAALNDLRHDREQALHTLKELGERVQELEEALSSAERASNSERSQKEQYEGMLKELQGRYSRVAHHLQELEEKRSSFAEGMREAKSQHDNVKALLQIAKEEASCIAVQRDSAERETKALTRDLEKARERIANQAKAIDDLQSEVTTTQEHLQLTVRKLESTTAQLNSTTEALKATTSKLQNANASLGAANASLDSANASLGAANASLKEKENEVSALEAQKASQAETIEKQKGDADDLMKIITQLEERLESRTEQLSALESAMQQYKEATGEALQKGTEELAKADALLKNKVERATEDVLQQNRNHHEQQMEKAKKEHEAEVTKMTHKNDNLSTYIQRSRHALGRAPTSTSVGDLKGIFEGAVLMKVCFHTRSHKSVQRFVKVTTEGVLVWSADLSGRGPFRQKKGVSIKDIFRVEYGPYSQAHLWYTGKESLEPAWRCFSLHATKRSYDFMTSDDAVVERFVLGLGRLVAQHSSAPTIQARGELLLRRVWLKLEQYCRRRKISHCTMWKEAIRRTLAQRPELLMRLHKRDGTEKQQPSRRK